MNLTAPVGILLYDDPVNLVGLLRNRRLGAESDDFHVLHCFDFVEANHVRHRDRLSLSGASNCDNEKEKRDA